jgi:alpha-tubulin suppressor-like RCC1 family protein
MAAKAISAGPNATCAVLSDGSVHCWGQSSGYQPNAGNTSNPAALAGLPKPASQISLGDQFGCALLSDTTVWCWGNGAAGQLGNDKLANSGPVQVIDLPSAASALAAGGSHACVIVSGGNVWCWGDNEEGQLGTGSATVAPPLGSAVPVQANLMALGSAVSLAAGEQTSYAVTSSSNLAGWGDNTDGELGNVTIQPGDLVSVAITASASAVSVAGGDEFACAILTDGTVWCWGNDMDGALGSGSTQFPDDPVPGPVVGLSTRALLLAAGGTSACTILQNNTLWCWGRIESSAKPVQVTGIPGALKQVTVGLDHACALTGNGSVWCWGNNNLDGQLGNGRAQTLTPGQVVPW